jgi:predicted MFS family arabinose efflux permease
MYTAAPTSNDPRWQHGLLTALGLALGPAAATGMARFAYALILPAMREDLGWSYAQAGWVSSANAIGYLLGAVLALRITAALDPRKLFLGGMAATALLLIASGMARHFEALLALRLATGISSALVFINGGVLAANVFPKQSKEAASAIAIYFGGGGLGILLSGAVLPWLFEVQGSATWDLAWIQMGLVSLLFVVPSAAMSARVMVAPAARQAAAWNRRPFMFSLIGHFMLACGYIAYMTFVIAWIRNRGSSTLEVSLVWSLLGLAVIVSPLLWRRPLQRWRGGTPLAAAIAVLALGALLPLLSANFAVVAASAALFGSALLIPPATATAFAKKSLPPAAWGSALATYTLCFAGGQCIGPLLTGMIADATGTLFGGLATSVAVLTAGALVSACQKDVVVAGNASEAAPCFVPAATAEQVS